MVAVALPLVLFAAAIALPAPASCEFSARRHPDRFCSVCMAMVYEVEAGLRETSTIKTQLTGPLGKKSDYTRSEARRADVLDNICARMREYQFATGSDEFDRRFARVPGDRWVKEEISKKVGMSEAESTCLSMYEKVEEHLEDDLFTPGVDFRVTVCQERLGACQTGHKREPREAPAAPTAEEKAKAEAEKEKERKKKADKGKKRAGSRNAKKKGGKGKKNDKGVSRSVLDTIRKVATDRIDVLGGLGLACLVVGLWLRARVSSTGTNKRD